MAMAQGSEFLAPVLTVGSAMIAEQCSCNWNVELP